MPESGPSAHQTLQSRTLLAFIVGQIGLHGAMAGTRMAVPLQALRQGYSPWTVGLLMALFAAAPVLLALPAGRLADRYGYHRPVRLAAGLSAGGALLALLATWLHGPLELVVLCMAACLSGGGANIGLIAIQRTAGRSAADSTMRMRIFSWLGLAPSLANLIGPVAAGLLIDWAGFSAAFGFMLLLPLASLGFARLVPREAHAVQHAAAPGGAAWDLWRTPGLQRLMLVNWLLSTCWDVHSFAIPILGHERGFSASTIGFVLGVFALSVSGVRLLIPMLAHRMNEVQVLRTAMLTTGVLFAAYPMLRSPWMMGACAVLLGLALGSVQPMIMSTLHHLTPHDRHGEAIALRSMAINFSSSLMPLLFGVAGSAIGVGPLFWLVGAAVGAGNWVARPLDAQSLR